MPPATMEKTDEKMVDVTINTEKGVAVRINPVDLKEAEGPAREVKRGEVIRVRRTLANLLVTNKQAVMGAVKLDGK